MSPARETLGDAHQGVLSGRGVTISLQPLALPSGPSVPAGLLEPGMASTSEPSGRTCPPTGPRTLVSHSCDPGRPQGGAVPLARVPRARRSVLRAEGLGLSGAFLEILWKA